MTIHLSIEGDWLRADGQGYELRPVCGNDFDGRKRLTGDPAQVSCRTCLALGGFDVPTQALGEPLGELRDGGVAMTQVFQSRIPPKGKVLCPNCGKPRYAIERCCDTYAGEERTFWNYEPTPARKVRVIVGKCERPTWWCAELEGTERDAVEVNYHGEKFYLDNDIFKGGSVGGYEHPTHPAGTGWNKVTNGRGGPDWGHSSLPVASVIEPSESAS